MDWLMWKEKGRERLKKYKYAALILLAGVFMMLLPQKKPEQPPVEVPAVQPDLQESLTGILSRVEGAGKVEVLLTEAAGERTVYQTDENSSVSNSGQDVRKNTVLLTAAGREEAGLVRQVIPPTYQGALVLCQGADNASVRLAIVQAVMSVTGLSSDKVTVLKMK